MQQHPFFQIKRQDYTRDHLDKESLCSNPFDQFKKWMQEADGHQIIEPSAAALATAANNGKPSCRMVILKGLDEKGFLFFTNYESRKGHEIAANPFAALTLYWKELERQVRIEGLIEKTSAETSKTYFNLRPRQSRLSAFVSKQSEVIPSRKALEDEVLRIEKIYENKEIPLPEFWGGYRLIPNEIEFWQGRANRLHDRFRYSVANDGWIIDQLAP